MNCDQVWKVLSAWLPSRGRSDTHDEINQELMFHFRELVREHLRGGMSFDAAWDAADERFGSLSGYQAQCQVVKLGRHMSWLIVALMATVIVAAYGAFRSPQPFVNQQLLDEFRQRESRLAVQIGALPQLALAQTEAAPAKPEFKDLTGTVRTADQPLTDATILVIIKSWPGGRYQQHDFSAKTDKDGQFRLPELIPQVGHYAVFVAALKNGYAFQSFYHLIKNPRRESLPEIRLELERAVPITFVIRDAAGQPIRGAKVIPSSRQPQQGEESLVYFQGAEGIAVTSDANGRIPMDCFRAGDTCKVFLQTPGSDWGDYRFYVEAENATINIATDTKPTK